jgi:hypothetical protein
MSLFAFCPELEERIRIIADVEERIRVRNEWVRCRFEEDVVAAGWQLLRLNASCSSSPISIAQKSGSNRNRHRNARTARDATGASAPTHMPIWKGSVIDGFSVSNHMWRKSGLRRGASEEMVAGVIRDAKKAEP